MVYSYRFFVVWLVRKRSALTFWIFIWVARRISAFSETGSHPEEVPCFFLRFLKPESRGFVAHFTLRRTLPPLRDVAPQRLPAKPGPFPGACTRLHFRGADDRATELLLAASDTSESDTETARAGETNLLSDSWQRNILQLNGVDDNSHDNFVGLDILIVSLQFCVEIQWQSGWCVVFASRNTWHDKSWSPSWMSDDLISLYNPWSREFGEYVIVFQVLNFMLVNYRFFGEYVTVFQGMFTFSKSHGTPSTTLYFHEFVFFFAISIMHLEVLKHWCSIPSKRKDSFYFRIFWMLPLYKKQ